MGTVYQKQCKTGNADAKNQARDAALRDKIYDTAGDALAEVLDLQHVEAVELLNQIGVITQTICQSKPNGFDERVARCRRGGHAPNPLTFARLESLRDKVVALGQSYDDLRAGRITPISDDELVDCDPSDGAPSIAPVEWPAPLDGAAMRGIIGEFMDIVLPNSECDTAALVLTLLSAVGNAFGGASYFAVGDERHPPRLNIGIVGATSKGRKGASVAPMMRLMRDADPLWAAINPRGGLVSGEGLINAVRDPNPDDGDDGVTDKRCFIIEPELIRVLRASERQGCNLSALIRQAWDSGQLSSLSRHKPLLATDAQISIVCHVTGEELRAALAQVELLNGFANRFLWCCSRRSKLVPMPQPSNPRAMMGVAARLTDAINRAHSGGRVTFTGEAAEAWCSGYSNLSMERPGIIGGVTGRSESYTSRLALTYALLDGSREITLDHLEAAAAVWRYCDASAVFLFGGSTGDRLADKLHKAIHESPDGLTRKQLLVDVCCGNVSADALDAAIDVLRKMGLIITETMQTRGRPATKYRPKV